MPTRVSDVLSALGSRRGAWRVAVIIALCLALAVPVGCVQTDGHGGYRLVKATILDSTASSEADSSIDTAAALLEGLSFVEGNPFFLNPREMMSDAYKFPLPTDEWIERCEFSYDEVGRAKVATFY
ncbi:MAG: hypothetical protein LBK67_09180, partial [Coriobacteriales bacterium]|nr:hypothetical protein [Coriobacteriales bacterium]